MSESREIELYHSIKPIIQPAEPWIVKFEATKQDSNGSKTLNAKIYRSPPLPMNHDIGLDAKYGMSVEVAHPIQKVCCQQSHVMNMDA
jgi:hypothetical protein